jgi:hypothetical protein
MTPLREYKKNFLREDLLCFQRGMRRTSTALYFYRRSKKSLHKPKAIYGNILFNIIFGFNYYGQLLCLQFLSKTHLNFLKFTFGIKLVLFLKSSLFQSRIDTIVHLQDKTFTYQLARYICKSVQLLS